MRFHVIGTSHRFSPIEIRERLCFSKKKLREVLDFLEKVPDIRSFFILSTCNRSEIYVWVSGEPDLARIFSEAHGRPEQELAPFLYNYEGADAFRHLLRVACGLDSRISGEPQIFGQVRRAVAYSENTDTLEPFALEVVEKAIGIAESIRRHTQAGSAPGTLADAAFDLIRRNEPDFRDKKFLLIGTGKIMELFVPILTREGIRPVIVSNRNHERAVEWARVTSGRAAHLEDLADLVPEEDIIVSATSCPHAVLYREHFYGTKKPVLVLDLAVPRDAEPSIKELAGVRLFDLDDVGFSLADGYRREWTDEAERRVRIESETLWKELSKSEPAKARSL